MPIGKFKGQPVEDMTTGYLTWLVTRDNIRFKHWPLIKEALRILRSRFENFDAVLSELKVDTPPPEYWKTPERAARKAKEKAEKLRKLEERRLAELHQRLIEVRARRAQRLDQQQQPQKIAQAEQQQPPAKVNATSPPGVLMDASYFVRQARQKRPDPDDVSDLV